VDREKLAEAKYLMESVGAAAADYQVRVWDLQRGVDTTTTTCATSVGWCTRRGTKLPGPARPGSVPTSRD
jgi:hypothetical protein